MRDKRTPTDVCGEAKSKYEDKLLPEVKALENISLEGNLLSIPHTTHEASSVYRFYTVIFTPRHAFYNANNPLYPITTIAFVTKSVTYIKRLLALKHHATLGKVIHHDEQASIRRIIIKKEYSIPNRLKKWMGRKLKPT